MNTVAIRGFVIGSGVLLIAVSEPALSDSHCPQSCIGDHCWTTAERDTVYGRGGGEYDLTTGFVSAWGCGGGGTGVRATDEFVLRYASGDPITFDARLTYWACGAPYGHDVGAQAQLFIWLDGTSVTTGPILQCPITGVLSMPITKGADEPFELHYWLSAGGASFDCGQAHATLSFGGLPPGARIESCHGFEQDVPVNAERTSWGAVKVRYR